MTKNSQDAKQYRDVESLLDTVAGSILILNPEGKILLANYAACHILGRNRDDLVGMDFSYPFEVGTSREVEIIGADGNQKYVQMYASQYEWDGDEAYVVTLFDVTTYKELLGKLEIANTVFKHAKEGIIVTDRDRNIISINKEFTNITGYHEEDVLGKNPSILNSGKQDEAFYAEMWRNINTKGYWFGQIWNKNKYGDIYPELLAISVVKNEVGQVTNYVGAFYDIAKQVTEQKRVIERIQYYDKLTGLPNRNLLPQLLDNKMDVAVKSEKQLVVIHVDIDNFKIFLDQYDQSFISKILQQFSRILHHELSMNDVLARVDADEFVVVLAGLDNVADYQRFIDKVNKRLHASIMINDKRIIMTASYGVAVYDKQQDLHPGQLIKQAEKAVFQSKLKGTNKTVIFDPKGEGQQKRYNQYLDKLLLAMRNGEFELYCQPKINLQDHTILGAEALLRWNHPSKGVLAPGKFMPPVGTDEYQLQLDKWVITYCVDHFLSNELFEDLIISANINIMDLQNKEFMQWLGDVAAMQPGGVIKNMEFEILETSAITNLKRLAYLLKKVSMLGVKFSLDDFGTAYSSLSYLKALPLHFMKIDQGFVRGCVDNKKDREILTGILALAKAINIKVVAEGAETEKHLAMLRDMGVQYAQGYAIAKAMPLHEFLKWCSEWRCKHSKKKAEH